MKTHLEAMAQDDAATLPQLEKVLQEFKVDEASLGSAGVQLFNFAIKCRDEQLFPCLCFQLDSFKCLELYKELLGTLESKQRVEFPNYYKDLEEKAAAERKKAVDAAKAAGSAAKGKKGKDDEDGGGGADEVPDDALLETFIDTCDRPRAPHSQRTPRSSMTSADETRQDSNLCFASCLPASTGLAMHRLSLSKCLRVSDFFLFLVCSLSLYLLCLLHVCLVPPPPPPPPPAVRNWRVYM
mmetsp:Transcript_33225/g.75059  ORF Transcript_33225/g.75059 Transcript_33225/m.75059 type:complete len:240 (-) Transcript_33225:138-857(-)